MNQLLTIFTPTYNRAYLLENLWKSLCEQTNYNFVWLIVDDGSTDNTKDVVLHWKQNCPFLIRYVYQKNSGKHVAHNYAAHICETPLFMCVDSDDVLTPEAVEIIHSYWIKDLGNKKEIVGWCTRRGDFNGRPVNDRNWPKKECQLSCVELFEKQNFHGETALIWKTKALRHYFFPVIPGENFVTELVLYYQMSLREKMEIKKDIFYLFSYREDGYTMQGIGLMVKNPIGASIAYRVRYAVSDGFWGEFKALTKYKAWNYYFSFTDKDINPYFNHLQLGGSSVKTCNILSILSTIAAFLCQPIVRYKILHDKK